MILVILFAILISLINTYVALHRKKLRKKELPIYLFTMILSVMAYVISYHFYSFSYEFIVFIVLFNLVINIFISDFMYYKIWDIAIIISSITLIINNFFYKGFKSTMIALLIGLLMMSIMFLFKMFGNYLFKEESIGGGDVKLLFLTGFTVGVVPSLITLIVSSLLAIPFAIMSSKKSKYIAYGPFIIIITLVMWLISDYVL